MTRLIIKRTQNRYFSIHTHSRFSVNDALPEVGALVAKAKELGYPALALTDHGNMAGTVQLYQECKKVGIKPMPGSELYLVIDREDKKAKRYHVGMVAYTTQGYRNLVRISTMTNENFRNKPILDLNDMAVLKDAGQTEGIALTTGCFFGLVVQTLVSEGYDATKKIVAMFASWFDTYVELQVHQINRGEGEMTEKDIVSSLIMIAKELGLPAVITQDSHYLNPEDKPVHESLKRLVAFGPDSDDAVFPGDSFHLADEKFLRSHYSAEEWEVGMAGLDLLLSKYDLSIPEMDHYDYRVPQVYEKPEEVLRKLMVKVTADKSPVVQARVKEELEVVTVSRMADYLLLVARVCQWLREAGIFYQIRGSAGGSMICYLLDITNVDPLKWKLRFDRFLSKDRLSPPDIDIDVEHSKRADVIEWLNDHYATVQIGNWRVYSIEGDSETTTGSLRIRTMSRIRASTGEADWASVTSEQRTELMVLSDADLYSGYGVHAAGLVVASSRKEIAAKLPMMWVASSKTMVTQYDGKDVEKIGVVKLDVLGVKTLTVLRRTMVNTGVDTTGGMEKCLASIPMTDQKTFAMLAKGDTSGVFQLEGGTATRYIRRLHPTKVSDLIASVALFRPGVMNSGATDSYLARKAGEEKPPERHSIITAVVGETHGILLYQDQVIDILRSLGMLADDLTTFLKAVKASNKNVTAAAGIMAHYEPIVEQMCRDKGMTELDIEWLWSALVAFSNYSFNRCTDGSTEVTVSGMSHDAETELFKSSGGRYGGQIMTIREFHNIFHGLKTQTRQKYRAESRGLWIAARDVDGRIRPARIKDVHANGVQEIWKVTTESGHSITATNNHRHLTDRGWVEVQDLKDGDSLAVMGPVEKVISNSNPDGVPGHIKNGRRGLTTWVKNVRSGGVCEFCGGTSSRMEIAHLDNNHSNHTPENIAYLCNPCHKKADYDLGSRKSRWSRGREILFSAVVSIEFAGHSDTYDLEMDSDDHSWVGDGVVTHNSHATIYGITAWRCAYLAVNFPLEFHAALLAVAAESAKGKEDKEKIYIRTARRRGMKILRADVNKSQASYSIDPDRKGIRKGLNSIKGMGVCAAENIFSLQPFTDIDDFAERVNKRSVSGAKSWLATHDWEQVNGRMETLYEIEAFKSLGVS